MFHLKHKRQKKPNDDATIRRQIKMELPPFQNRRPQISSHVTHFFLTCPRQEENSKTLLVLD
jgi:hypothetical protein